MRAQAIGRLWRLQPDMQQSLQDCLDALALAGHPGVGGDPAVCSTDEWRERAEGPKAAEGAAEGPVALLAAASPGSGRSWARTGSSVPRARG
eukprot:13828028-Alexandrium_andersonii.AAC.1